MPSNVSLNERANQALARIKRASRVTLNNSDVVADALELLAVKLKLRGGSRG